MRRIRKAEHHRGWAARQWTPESLARDIVASIQAKAAKGITADMTTYTQNPDVIGKVEALLRAA